MCCSQYHTPHRLSDLSLFKITQFFDESHGTESRVSYLALESPVHLVRTQYLKVPYSWKCVHSHIIAAFYTVSCRGTPCSNSARLKESRQHQHGMKTPACIVSPKDVQFLSLFMERCFSSCSRLFTGDHAAATKVCLCLLDHKVSFGLPNPTEVVVLHPVSWFSQDPETRKYSPLRKVSGI